MKNQIFTVPQVLGSNITTAPVQVMEPTKKLPVS